MSYCLTIQKDLPALIGINHTHIICQIEYLIRNGKDTRMSVDEDGCKWLSKTYQEWNKIFDWLSLSGLRKCFRQLKQLGYINIIQGRDRNQFALTALGKSLFNIEQSEPETPEKEMSPNDEIAPPDDALSNSQTDTEYQAGCHSVTPLSYIYKKNNKSKDITTGGNNRTGYSDAPPETPPPDILIEFRDKLCDICQKDKNLPRIKRQANRVANELLSAGYRLPDLDHVSTYVASDWHFHDIEFVQVQDVIFKAVQKYGSGQIDTSGCFGKSTKKSAAARSQYGEMKGVYATDLALDAAVMDAIGATA